MHLHRTAPRGAVATCSGAVADLLTLKQLLQGAGKLVGTTVSLYLVTRHIVTTEIWSWLG